LYSVTEFGFYLKLLAETQTSPVNLYVVTGLTS